MYPGHCRCWNALGVAKSTGAGRRLQTLGATLKRLGYPGSSERLA